MRQAKLGASCRVEVPVRKDLASHLYRILRAVRRLREADIKGFFDNLDHQWLMEMLSHRIEDKALPNLINQWLKARIKTPEHGIEKPTSGHGFC